MSSPVPPRWLDPADVSLWLKLNPAPVAGSDEFALLEFCCGWAEATAERYRPEFRRTDPDTGAVSYVPDEECRGAAVALAGRIWRRRSSPAGVETFADSTMYVARYDPEIERGLHMAGWLTPTLTFGERAVSS